MRKIEKKKITICLVFLLLLICLFTSCISYRADEVVQNEIKISRVIGEPGIIDSNTLFVFFMENNPEADSLKITRLINYYLEECKIEGINSDIAFVQMCLETGFLRFGGLVTEDMNNFCGLGAIDINHPGEIFPTEQFGVRAHVQHLQAYGTNKPLVQSVIDKRYKYVNPKGKAPTVFELATTWASDKLYGEKLDKLLWRLETYKKNS